MQSNQFLIKYVINFRVEKGKLGFVLVKRSHKYAVL